MSLRGSSEEKNSQINEFSELLIKNSTHINAEQALSLVAQCRATLKKAKPRLIKSSSQRLKRHLELPKQSRACFRAFAPMLLLIALLVATPHTLISGKFDDLNQARYFFVEFVANYQREKASNALEKTLTFDEQQLLSVNSKSLYENNSNDIRYLSSYLLDYSNVASLALFEEARTLDPDNAWLTALHAGVLNDRVKFNKALPLLHLAATQSKYRRYPSELHKQKIALFRDSNLGTDINLHKEITSLSYSDQEKIIKLLERAIFYSSRLTSHEDAPELEKLCHSICSLLQKIASEELPLKEITRLANFVDYSIHKLADSAHKAELTELKNQLDIQKVSAQSYHNSIQVTSHSYPSSIIHSFQDGTQLIKTQSSELKPGNLKYLLAMEGTYASITSSFILIISLLFLTASFFGSFSNKTFAFALQPLFPPLKLFLFALSALVVPLFIYFIITRWTPFGCRTTPIHAQHGYPFIGQLHLCLFLTLSFTIALSGSLVRNTLHPLSLSKNFSLISWLPALFLIAALIKQGFPLKSSTSFPTTENLISVALSLHLIQFLLFLTGHGNSAIARILVCRFVCASIALSSLALLALLPAFSWRESYWSEQDNFSPVPNSSIHLTQTEAQLALVIQKKLQTELAKLPTS